jgi:hypothetical protein
MKTVKKYRKVVWAIEHRKNCLLRSIYETSGVATFATRKLAEIEIKDTGIEGKAVKVLITIERPNIYG